MLYDLNSFKPYIFFGFQNLSMCHTYIYSIGHTAKSIEYQFLGQFPKFLELPRQFSPDISGSRVSSLYNGVSAPLEP
jgi:hypothetical protein